MKFFHALRQDLNKTIINTGFIGAVLLTTILCFTANAYHDVSNDKAYSVFEAIFTLDRKFIESEQSFASITLFGNGMSGYITMFIPIIVAFPFMVSFCAERNSGGMRFTITRTSKVRYYLSKFTASFLSGGLATFLGMAIYGIAVFLIFPSINSYNIEPEMMQFILPNGVGKTILLCLGSAFVYGAFSTLPAFFLSSISRNPYLITCVPFMLVYIQQTAVQKIMSAGWSPEATESQRELSVIAQDFMPSAVTGLVRIEQWDGHAQRLVFFNGGLLLLTIIGFTLIMNLRQDKGA